MKITKYVAQIPFEVMVDWTESRTTYTEIICERKEEAIQIFRDIIANNFTYLENDVQGHFYIIERVIDIEKFFAQDTKLYWASIRGKRINGTGIDEEEVYLSDTPSSYYEKEYYEYQKEIRQLLTSTFPAIEDREKNNKLCSLTDDMHNQCLYYIEVKNREERYKKMKWWEN